MKMITPYVANENRDMKVKERKGENSGPRQSTLELRFVCYELNPFITRFRKHSRLNVNRLCFSVTIPSFLLSLQKITNQS